MNAKRLTTHHLSMHAGRICQPIVGMNNIKLLLASNDTRYNREIIDLVMQVSGTRFDVYKKVILPSSVPGIISNMKVNIGLCLVGVIIGEFLSAQAGLGFLIIYGSQVFKLDLVIMSIVILCVLSAVLYQAVTMLEKRCVRHH